MWCNTPPYMTTAKRTSRSGPDAGFETVLVAAAVGSGVIANGMDNPRRSRIQPRIARSVKAKIAGAKILTCAARKTEPRGVGFERGNHIGDDFVERHAEFLGAMHDLFAIHRARESFVLHFLFHR